MLVLHSEASTDRTSRYECRENQKHIVSYIEQNNILTYHLCWFGGEPLMQKNRVVEISNDLYQYCLVNNIEFCGQITTNGALLDEKLICQLSSVKIDRYQITIDGNRENHNQTKRGKQYFIF